MSLAPVARMVLLCGTAALLVAGCGSTGSNSGSSSSASPTPSKATAISKADACTLVTADDASAAVGTTVTNAGGATTPGICLYATADFQTTVVAFAQVYPDSTSASKVSPQQLAAALNGAYGLGTAKVVTGIGDKAVEYTLSAASGANGIVIFVFKSNVVLMIAVTGTSDSGKVEQLAKKAVGKI